MSSFGGDSARSGDSLEVNPNSGRSDETATTAASGVAGKSPPSARPTSPPLVPAVDAVDGPKNEATHQALQNGTRVLCWSPATLAALTRPPPKQPTIPGLLAPCVEVARLHLSVLLLRPLGFFKHLPRDTLEAAARLFEPRFSVGQQLIYSQGEVADALYVVAEGKCTLRHPAARGGRAPWTQTIDAHDHAPWFGVAVLLDTRKKRPATAHTVDAMESGVEARLLVLPASAVDALLALLPQFLLVSKGAPVGGGPARASSPSGKSTPNPRPPAATILRRWEKVYLNLQAHVALGGKSLSLTMQSDYYANYPGEGVGANKSLPGPGCRETSQPKPTSWKPFDSAGRPLDAYTTFNLHDSIDATTHDSTVLRGKESAYCGPY